MKLGYLMPALFCFAGGLSASEPVAEEVPSGEPQPAAVMEASAVEAPATTPAAEGLHLALVSAGGVDQELMKHLHEWAATQSGLMVDLLEERAVEGATDLYAVAEKANSELGGKYGAVVVVVNPGSVFKAAEHAVSVIGGNTAAVNLDAFEGDMPSDEILARRLERAVNRGFGFLLGAEAVPVTTSCMYPYANMEELDSIARGFDPPTLTRIQMNAVGRGIALNLDSPYMLLQQAE